MKTEHRIISVDGHIIAQFNQFTGPDQTASWYTCSRADNNNDAETYGSQNEALRNLARSL